jgi:enamine deaminase RidA (YjgF/YER057c/UK114 family)
MSIIEERIKEMGLELPVCPKPVAAYVAGVKLENNLLFVSGQTAKKEGKPYLTGKVGEDITLEQAYDASKICALMLLSEVKLVLGDLDKVERIVKVNGYVNSTADFCQQPKVINGASEFLEAVFKERGKHARTAISVAALPENASVEIEMIVSYCDKTCNK